MIRRVAIAGASGVVGSAAVEAFAAAGHEVIAISRRQPVIAASTRFRHLALDLADPAQCRERLRDCAPVTHLVYAAVSEEPGLVSGWTDPQRIADNAAMFRNIAEPLAQGGHLAWCALQQGTKAYGAHLHPIALPAREESPRDAHRNFYFEQEDEMRGLAERHGFAWTVLRPQVVFGSAPGAAMNPVAAIGAYAALCRETGRPFAYPASAQLIWEAADADLIGEALVWASADESAQAGTFNLTNGDIFVLHDDWPAISGKLGLAPAPPAPGGLADYLESAEAQAAWSAMAARENLREPRLSAFLGQSHRYLDLLLSEAMIAKRALPTLVSTIRIRQAGFGACRDTLASLLHWLGRMEALRLLPPMTRA